MESEFNVNIPDDAAQNIRSVRDVVEGIAKLIRKAREETTQPPGLDDLSAVWVRQFCLQPVFQPASRNPARMPAAGKTACPTVMQRRVVVTGIGVSGPRPQPREFWNTLPEGRSAIRPLKRLDRFAPFPERSGRSEIGPAAVISTKRRSALLDRFAQFGAVAAREAVAGRIEWTPALREETAIVTGSCVGGQTTEDEGFVSLYRNNIPRVNPLTIPRTMENAAASRISLETGIVGPTYTVSTACSSSNHAIGQAFWMVRGAGQDGDHGRKRSGLQPGFSQGVGSDAGGIAGYLPSVFEGSPRVDPGRGRGHAGVGAVGIREARGATIYAR